MANLERVDYGPGDRGGVIGEELGWHVRAHETPLHSEFCQNTGQAPVNTASVSCARPWDTNLSQDNRPISRLGWIEGRNLQIEAVVTKSLSGEIIRDCIVFST